VALVALLVQERPHPSLEEQSLIQVVRAAVVAAVGLDHYTAAAILIAMVAVVAVVALELADWGLEVLQAAQGQMEYSGRAAQRE